jgi:hypothetical protein
VSDAVSGNMIIGVKMKLSIAIFTSLSRSPEIVFKDGKKMREQPGRSRIRTLCVPLVSAQPMKLLIAFGSSFQHYRLLAGLNDLAALI